MKIKIDPVKGLSIAATVLGVVGTLISNKVDTMNKKSMKEEITKEVLESLKAKES